MTKITISGGTLEAEIQETESEQAFKQIISGLVKETGTEIGAIKNALQNITFASRITSQRQSLALDDIRAELQYMGEEHKKLEDTNKDLKGKISQVKTISTTRLQNLTDRINKLKTQRRERIKTVIKKEIEPIKPKELPEYKLEPSKKGEVKSGKEYMGHLDFPKTDKEVRESIKTAGVSPHSSKSDMQDKLGAKPKMPI